MHTLCVHQWDTGGELLGKQDLPTVGLEPAQVFVSCPLVLKTNPGQAEQPGPYTAEKPRSVPHKIRSDEQAIVSQDAVDFRQSSFRFRHHV